MRIDFSSGLRPSGDSAGRNTSALSNFRVESPDDSGATPNVPRNGIASYIASGIADKPFGLYAFKDQMIVATRDGYVYRAPSSAPTSVTPLSFSATVTSMLNGLLRPTFAEDPTDLFVANGGRILKWTPGDIAAAHITASNAPVKTTHMAVLGQRLIANDISTDAKRQQFFYSDLGDGSDSTWQALSFQTAEARPDNVVALADNTSDLFVWGTSTLQVFGVSSDPSVPFSPSNTVNVGCSAPYSIVRVDDAFAFIDDKRRIVISAGRGQVRVISDDIESWLRTNTISDCWAWRETTDWWDFLVFHFEAAHRTLELNLKSNRWSDRTYNDGAVTSHMPIDSYAYWPALNIHLHGSSIASAVYTQTATRTDLGNQIIAQRTTGWYGSSDLMRSDRITVVVRRGTVTPATTPGVLEVRVDDDGQGWTDWESVSIGNEGDGDFQTVHLYTGGTFFRRRYDFRYAGSDDTAIVEAFDEMGPAS